jgi:hypothetical protein
MALGCSLCNLGKGYKEWEHTWLDWKLITPVKICFASKVLMFQPCLMYWQAIVMCYSHQIEACANMIPSTMTWTTVKVIYETFFLVVITCMVNQSHGYWLFSNAIANTIWNWRRRDWTYRPRLILLHFWTSKWKWNNLGLTWGSKAVYITSYKIIIFYTFGEIFKGVLHLNLPLNSKLKILSKFSLIIKLVIFIMLLFNKFFN